LTETCSLSQNAFESIAVFDLDDTLLKKNCSKYFFFFLLKKKYYAKRSLFFYFLCYVRFRFITHSLEDLHKRVFKRFLKGKNLDFLEAEAKEFWSIYFTPLIRGSVLERLLQAKSHGAMTLILSSSPEFLIKPLAEKLEVCLYRGSQYNVDEKNCLIEIGSIVHGPTKATYVQELKEKFRLKKISAYSDDISDLPLLKVACQPICVQPKRKLAGICKKNKWETINR